MNILKLLLLLPLSLLTFQISLFAQHTRQTDSLVLVKLYNATDGSNWNNNQNWLTGPINTWYGVTIQSLSGRISRLHLYNNNLTGELPDELATLDSAKSIILSNNNLYGNIPLINEIPFYKTYHDTLYGIDSPYRLSYQNHPLTGNYYQFSDVEKDTSIYNRSKLVKLTPKSAYENVLKSKQFGTQSEQRLSQGSSYTFSFPYKKSRDTLSFFWYVAKGNTSILMGQTYEPEFTITSFDSSLHTGAWICEIKRSKFEVPQNEIAATQWSVPFYLAGSINRNPEISIYKASGIERRPYETSDIYIRSREEEFDLLQIKGGDDMDPQKLTFRILYEPMALQMRIRKGEFATEFLSPSGFSGSEFYFINFKRKDYDWIGIDSLVIEVQDEDGGTDQSVFYFESVKEPEMLIQPVLKYTSISHKTTASGTWVYFENTKGIEKLFIDVFSDLQVDTGCTSEFFDFFSKEILFADSVFIPEIKEVSNKYISYTLSIIPLNKVEGGDPVTYSIIADRAPESLIPLSNFEFTEHPNISSFQITPKSFMTDCGNAYKVYEIVKGTVVSEKEIFANTGSTYYYELKRGVPYQYVIRDLTNRFRTDTIHVSFPRLENPKVVGSLDWAFACKKRIKKNSWVVNYYPPLKWEVDSTEHFKVVISYEYIEIITKDAGWSGTETIPVKITDGEGYVIDTFATVTQISSDTPLAFQTDTLRLNIKNEWTEVNLLSELEEAETADSLIELRIIKQGGIRLKDSNYKTQLLPGRGMTGIDTLTLEAIDEGCFSDTMTFIITYDSEGIMNTPPIFTTPLWFTDTLYKMQFSTGYLYKDDLLKKPLVFDLRELVQDDQPFEDLKFYFAETDKYGNDKTSDITIDRGLDITIVDGILTIKPRESEFYGYTYIQEGRALSTSFWLRFYAEDRFGERISNDAKLGIVEKPITFKPGVHYIFHSCPGDTLTIDVQRELELSIAGEKSLPPFTLFSSENLDYDVDGNKILYVQKSAIFTPQDNPITVILMLNVPFYNTFGNPQYSNLVFNNFYITAHPACNSKPVIQPIPVQKLLNGQPVHLNLWNKVQDDQQGKDLFWMFSGGENLQYTYNFYSGELKVAANDGSWTGVDTLYVKVEDIMGQSALAAILFTNSGSPLIHPVPNKISITKGETIPVITLWDKVTDDQTSPEQIQWKVITESVLEGTVSESGELTLTLKDTSWTGTTTVSLIAKDEAGLTDTATFTIEVNDLILSAMQTEMECASRFYPNPVNDLLTIRSCTHNAGSTIRLLDALGQVKLEQSLVSGAEQKIDVSDMEPGLYFLMISDKPGGQKEIGKIMIH